MRVRISDAATGAVKLDTRFPAGFLGGVANIIPQVAGMDLEGLLRGGGGGGGGGDGGRRTPGPGEPAFSFEADTDRIDIFIEY